MMYKSILFSILASISVALMGVAVKHLQLDHLPNSLLLFARFSVSFVLLLPMTLADREFTFHINRPSLLMVRGILGTIAMACFFYGIKYLPLANAVLLTNCLPIYVPIFVWLIMGISTNFKVWLSIVVSLVGVIFILQPQGHQFLQWHTFIASMAGVLGAGAVVCLKMLTKEGNRSSSILFYYFLISMICVLPWVIMHWQTPHGMEWLWLLMVGVFGGLFQLLFTMASQRLPIRVASPLLFVGVVASAFLGWAFWGEVPGWYEYLGALVVFLGIIGVVRYNN